MGSGRWLWYGLFTVAIALLGWLLDGVDGFLLALAVLSVALFLVEGVLQTRSSSPPRIGAASERYRAQLHALRAGISLTTTDRAGDSYPPYFPLPCLDSGDVVHPSALALMLDWATDSPPATLALYGSYGTGKSTTCLEFCLRLLDQPGADLLPVYLPLNSIGEQPPAEWLSELLTGRYDLLSHPGDPTASLTQDRRVCLVFDGLESVDEYFAHPLAGPLLQKAATGRRVRVVLSARRLAADFPLNEDEPAKSPNQLVESWLGLLPLDAETQRAYAAKIHQSQGHGDPPGALSLAMLDRPFLIDLAYCATAAGARVGTSLSSLYRAAIGVVLAADADDKPTAPPADVTQAALTRFAFEAYLQGQEQFPLDAAVDYIERGTSLRRADVSAALNSCRLLTDYGGRVGFAHRSLEEFFVAMACLDAIRGESWNLLEDFLLIDPVLEFLEDLIRLAPDTAQLATLVAERFTEAVSTPEETGNHLQANLASLMSSLGRSMGGLELVGLRLAGATLRNADLEDAQIVDTDLSGVDLSGANLSNAVLERVDLRNAFVHEIDCRATRFLDCDFWNLRWLDEPPSLWAARWHPREPILACGLSSGHVALLELTKGHDGIERSADHVLGPTGVLEVDLDGGGALLASDRAGRVVEMKVSSGSALALVESHVDKSTHAANVRRIRFAPGGKTRYATASRDGFVRLFLPGQTAPYRQHGRHRSPVMDLAWDPRGSLLASAGYDGQAYVWETTTPYRQPIAAGSGDAEPNILRAVGFSPSGEILAAAGESGTLVRWEVSPSGQPSSPAVLASLPSAVFALAFVSETCVVAGTWEGEVFLIDQGKARLIWKHDDAVRSIDVAHERIMSASWDGGLIIGTQQGEPLTEALHAPFPQDASPTSASNFSQSQMLRPQGLSPRFLNHLERLGVDVQE